MVNEAKWQKRQVMIDDWYVSHPGTLFSGNCPLLKKHYVWSEDSVNLIYVIEYTWENGERAILKIRPVAQGSHRYVVDRIEELKEGE